MAKINGSETVQEMLLKLVEGNPGAIRVCMEIYTGSAKIDPDCMPLLHLLAFDDLGIYGSRIWMLYKDVCKHDLTHTIGMLRAQQLGFITREELNHAIDNYGAGLDVGAVLAQVRERLPAFKQAEKVEVSNGA